MQAWTDAIDSWATSLLEEVDLSTVLINLVLTLVMSQLLAWHYIRFAPVLSNKRKFARTFVFLSATTLLVISIVSSSLALSLGLVGALSIVRFRTPIKEPEELAYLYLAIATGIGMGANEPLLTMIVYAVILIWLTLQHAAGGGRVSLRTVLHVSVPTASGESGVTDETRLAALLPVVRASCRNVDLRRIDSDGLEFSASLLVEVDGEEALARLLSGLQTALPGAAVSLVERDGGG